VSTHQQIRDAVLSARPGQMTKSGRAGLQRLGLGSGRDGILYVPDEAFNQDRPLIVLLHGSGADSHDIAGVLQGPSEEEKCILLVPDSREYTWDVLISGFGADVRLVDRALSVAFAQCRVDRSRIAIAGFSDGASYALSVGITNGDLFTHIVAFSPGFMIPPRIVDAPHIYMSHGVRDTVLPIERCSRRIVPTLKEWNYDVTYREFPDGHVVPEQVANEAMRWFLSSPAGVGG
jgi:phospholipase/carboxylesterase